MRFLLAVFPLAFIVFGVYGYIVQRLDFNEPGPKL